MALPTPPPVTNPIPNNPFYSPFTPYVCGPYFPVATSAGIDISTGTAIPQLVNDVQNVLTAGPGIALSTLMGVTTITATGGGGGSTTWATLGDKNNPSGPTEIALGQDAGGSQGTYAIALGANAGFSGQGLGAVSIGVFAGNSTQGTGAVAIGGAAGQLAQGDCAVALGQTAGAFNQGVEALALGSQAGVNSQASCSIVINASGAPLDNTVSGTTVIAPVRNAGSSGLPAGFFQVAYNPTTGELVYHS